MGAAGHRVDAATGVIVSGGSAVVLDERPPFPECPVCSIVPAMAGSELQRKRLPPEERERMIVNAAIAFYAEVGFSGDTRELARRIGIAQPLLYRYFRSKEALIERVFDEVYVNRFQPHWVEFLSDRSVPLRQRLIDFAKAYTKTTFREEWIRIYTFAGLKDGELNRRYIKTVTEPVLRKICKEIRHEHGFKSKGVRISDTELNLAWIWHGGLYYWAIRKYIYNVQAQGSLPVVIEYSTDGLICGCRHYLADRCTRDA